jgi:hypothetical protein
MVLLVALGATLFFVHGGVAFWVTFVALVALVVFSIVATR